MYVCIVILERDFTRYKVSEVSGIIPVRTCVCHTCVGFVRTHWYLVWCAVFIIIVPDQVYIRRYLPLKRKARSIPCTACEIQLLKKGREDPDVTCGRLIVVLAAWLVLARLCKSFKLSIVSATHHIMQRRGLLPPPSCTGGYRFWV